MLTRLFHALLRLIAPLFFGRRYLRGKSFELGRSGWWWVWRSIWLQKILGINRKVPWPVHPAAVVKNWRNIEFDPLDLNNFQMAGCYFQNARGRIVLGKGTYIGPNVGIITANHDPDDPDRHLPGRDVVIGAKCWIGMNSVILPGVRLGDHTVVGAGAVVTRSFPEGRCVLAGAPARVVKAL